MFDLGNLAVLKNGYENSLTIYSIAKKYGYKDSLLNIRVTYVKSVLQAEHEVFVKFQESVEREKRNYKILCIAPPIVVLLLTMLIIKRRKRKIANK